MRQEPILGRIPLQHCAGIALCRKLAIFWTAILLSWSCSAAIQFDVFLGCDGIIPDCSWFPVVCEIKNDGPTFTGVVEVSPGASQRQSDEQVRRTLVELPTGTLKRITIPVFPAGRGYGTWDVRLLDQRGKPRGEQLGLTPRKIMGRDTSLMGCLPRTAAGAPMIRAVSSQQAEAQPATARFQPSVFPDNPLVLEGMNAFYLNSERALELREGQIAALQGWLYAGGHLIVAVEQIADVNSTPWLQKLFPLELKENVTVREHPALQAWLTSAEGWRSGQSHSTRSVRKKSGRVVTVEEEPSGQEAVNPFPDLADDLKFETSELQVLTGKLKDGQILAASGEVPLMVSANRGRGRVTALLFSPEREPVRSWRNLPVLWAKLAEVPAQLYVTSDFYRPGGWSLDAVFGAMLETTQVHKLPIAWLLLLLVTYLVVIGPLDHYWLKRIGRPMLTWITFPCYVVVFSALIYVLGYKLRAGESEWNELNVVDVLSPGAQTECRGRTYVSIYSPSNQRYGLQSSQRFAALRDEFSGWGGMQGGNEASILQNGDNYKAEIFVPVWTSQHFINDWWDSIGRPVEVSVQRTNDTWEVTVRNRTPRKLTDVRFAINGRIATFGELPAQATRVFSMGDDAPQISSFVSNAAAEFSMAVQSRMNAFGSSARGRIGDPSRAGVSASFSSLARGQNQYRQDFTAAPGVDMEADIRHGNAVLFAWDENFSPVQSIQRFTTKRSRRDTLWRVAVQL